MEVVVVVAVIVVGVFEQNILYRKRNTNWKRETKHENLILSRNNNDGKSKGISTLK